MFSNSPYFGVDIDDIEDAISDYKYGDADNIVAEFIHSLQSYAEYSQSGNGIHVICRGNSPDRPPQEERRVLFRGRYFIMTGNAASDYTEITECTDKIKPLHEKYIGGGTEPTTGIVAALPLNLSEAEIIKLAESSKQGAAFNSLYSGSWDMLYTSQSKQT